MGGFDSPAVGLASLHRLPQESPQRGRAVKDLSFAHATALRGDAQGLRKAPSRKSGSNRL
jgi:hypothetical protein